MEKKNACYRYKKREKSSIVLSTFELVDNPRILLTPRLQDRVG